MQDPLWTLTHLFAGISATLYGAHLLLGPSPTRLYHYLGRFSLLLGGATFLKALSWLHPEIAWLARGYRCLLALVPVLAATATEFVVQRHLSPRWKWTLLLASLGLPLWALSGLSLNLWDALMMVLLMATFGHLAQHFARAWRHARQPIRQRVYQLFFALAASAPVFVASDSLFLIWPSFPRLSCVPILLCIFVFSHGLHKSTQHRFSWVSRKLSGAALVSLAGAQAVLFILEQPQERLGLVWWTFMLLYVTVEPLRMFHHYHRQDRESLLLGRLQTLSAVDEHEVFRQLERWPEVLRAVTIGLDADYDEQLIHECFEQLGPVAEMAQLRTRLLSANPHDALGFEQLQHLLASHDVEMLVPLDPGSFLGLRFEVGHDLTSARHLAGLLASHLRRLRGRR